MAVVSKGVFIVAGKRTPFGKFGGMFRDVSAEDLFATAAKAAFRAGEIDPGVIDTVNIGQISPLSKSGMSPRHAALKAGVPRDKPVLAINKMSGSAFEAIVNSTQEILLGSAKISLAGGMENLSSVPFLVRNVRFGVNFGTPIVLEDFLSSSNYDYNCQMPLLRLFDILAKKYDLTRMELDEFALRSQRKWKFAHENRIFETELAPVKLKVKDKEVILSCDEYPRPDISMEHLAKLPAVFNGGVTTSGNACGINDGAGAIILASEGAVLHHNLVPLSRVVGWSSAGTDPMYMGIAPVTAVQKLLHATGLTLNDIDLVEIHETFAAQVLACFKLLKVDDDKLNLNGGALAIGHPSGASGARIIAHLTHELRRKRLKRGIATVCIAGGQASALLIENVN